MQYKVTRNGKEVKGKTIYTKRGLFFVSGTEIYEEGGFKVEANFSNRPTNLTAGIFIFLTCLIISLINI